MAPYLFSKCGPKFWSLFRYNTLMYICLLSYISKHRICLDGESLECPAVCKSINHHLYIDHEVRDSHIHRRYKMHVDVCFASTLSIGQMKWNTKTAILMENFSLLYIHMKWIIMDWIYNAFNNAVPRSEDSLVPFGKMPAHQVPQYKSNQSINRFLHEYQHLQIPHTLFGKKITICT